MTPRPPPQQSVTPQSLVAAVVLTALIATAVTFFAIAAFIDGGPAGPRGTRGATGPPGPRATGAGATATVGSDAIVKAIEDDPAAVADALKRGDGTGAVAPGDIGTRVDELESKLADLRDQVGQLCDALATSGAADPAAASVSC